MRRSVTAKSVATVAPESPLFQMLPKPCASVDVAAGIGQRTVVPATVGSVASNHGLRRHHQFIIANESGDWPRVRRVLGIMEDRGFAVIRRRARTRRLGQLRRDPSPEGSEILRSRRVSKAPRGEGRVGRASTAEAAVDTAGVLSNPVNCGGTKSMSNTAVFNTTHAGGRKRRCAGEPERIAGIVPSKDRWALSRPQAAPIVRRTACLRHLARESRG
jgi:hypothetical protein